MSLNPFSERLPALLGVLAGPEGCGAKRKVVIPLKDIRVSREGMA